MRLAIAWIVLAACGRTPADSGASTQRPNIAPITSHQDASSMSSTSWRTRAIANHGVSIDLVDGVDAVEGDGGGQHYVIQRRDGVVAAIRIGDEMTLAWWRANFGERKLAFNSESAIRVCGREAKRQEVSLPAETATGIVPGKNDLIGHVQQNTPAQVHVAVSATTASGNPFVMTWVVTADRREALRADEDHFFGSVRCD